MINPKAMEAWFILMAEATKGTKEAREAFQSLSQMSGDPEEINRWMATFMPGAMPSSGNLQPEAFEEWMEESWRMMGVVPRSRYLDLLEKCDTLQRKLDKAEETIQKLRTRLDNREQQEEDAQKVADLWGTMMEDTLKAQTEWMRGWTESMEQPSEDDLNKPEDPAAEEPDSSTA